VQQTALLGAHLRPFFVSFDPGKASPFIDGDLGDVDVYTF
jgi:hypothetical protein